MLLSNKLVQRSWAHPRRERLGVAAIFGLGGSE
jgi:hypothetical protein